MNSALHSKLRTPLGEDTKYSEAYRFDEEAMNVFFGDNQRPHQRPTSQKPKVERMISKLPTRQTSAH